MRPPVNATKRNVTFPPFDSVIRAAGRTNKNNKANAFSFRETKKREKRYLTTNLKRKTKSPTPREHREPYYIHLLGENKTILEPHFKTKSFAGAPAATKHFNKARANARALNTHSGFIWNSGRTVLHLLVYFSFSCGQLHPTIQPFGTRTLVPHCLAVKKSPHSHTDTPRYKTNGPRNESNSLVKTD